MNGEQLREAIEAMDKLGAIIESWCEHKDVVRETFGKLVYERCMACRSERSELEPGKFGKWHPPCCDDPDCPGDCHE